MLRRELDKFYKKLLTIQKSGATRNESVISDAFKSLLDAYCDTKDLILLREETYKNTRIRPDGTVRGALPNLDYGHWESKDIYDNIDIEIDKKIEKGYPTDNIIFENSQTIVLIQKIGENRQGEEVMRCDMTKPKELDRILRAFLDYQPKVITDFFEAIKQFKEEVPYIADELRKMIMEQAETNEKFKIARADFWELCRQSIDPTIKSEDIREMLIQHILTDEIFSTVYNETHFHRENNVAIELQKVVDTFFTREVRYNTLAKIDHYYETIKTYAAQIGDYHQKQDFLKIVYENFYKAYNPKGADKLGVVFTPNEIVRFMIESTDYLVEYHFKKTLSDENVQILDPTTGTGTFITDLLRYINPQKLEYKYRNEIHANEISILPYYIANLNIEFTYKQIMNKYVPFNNIVFVDTLENYHALNWERKGKDQAFQKNLFAVSNENLELIKNQNKKKISVIIGNPPYNANQQNWNDFNKNKDYPQIDERIKDTYVKFSNATKTKVYDMFSRFFRWASDRVSDDGVIAFVTNNALINKKTYDGFRASISQEFQYAYIVDLGGDIREFSGRDGIFMNENHTIFGKSAAVGIAIVFLVRDSSKKDKECLIKYIHPCDIRATRREKLEYLADNKFYEIPFNSITPVNNNWTKLGKNDFWDLIPLINKKQKGKFKEENSIFDFYSNGVATNRDEWVYDISKKELNQKIKYAIAIFNSSVKNKNIDKSIKWSDTLTAHYKKNTIIELNADLFKYSHYRPFFKVNSYCEKRLNDRLTVNHYKIFGEKLNKKNKQFCFMSNEQTPIVFLAVNTLTDLNFCARGGTCVPLYTYEKNKQTSNVTDWGLNLFKEHYKDKKITKEDIFHYAYAAIHNPIYREKYKNNLKREFPRILFYKDFKKWSGWGKKLLNLHINYEAAKPYKLKIVHQEKPKENPKVKLKAIKDDGMIIIDENTTISNIPDIAWEYKLGNRSALEWVLNQYQEKKYSKKAIDTYPHKKTLHEKFNNYKFSDFKDFVIELLQQLTTVSVKTMEIMNEMKKETL